MKDLLGKFVELERRLSQEKGEFALFALFLREDALDKWDLIVAAPWIDADRKQALAYITSQIQQLFKSDELTTLSRVVLVDQSNPAVDAMNQALNSQHGQTEVRDSNFFGLQIKHAYIITSQRLNVNAEIPA
ncbi:MAG TPA: hypothetical protein VNO50_04510 [Pyrinomonadaceae bacterium]|nr:hypothetical protein [Pyrinomonadaceae bacterium]